jgi:phosphoglycolate phosphatase-like HAD superfamily hydrolase
MKKLILKSLTAIFLLTVISGWAQDPLPSWNDGPAKKAIIEFVKTTTTKGNVNFVPVEERIATFDQDGTCMVEKPIASQMVFCLQRVGILAQEKPELKETEPFKTVLSGDRAAIAKLSMPDIEKIILTTLSGMTTDQFQAQVKQWLATAKDPRWKRPYTDLIYLPMKEVLKYLRANGYKTYIVTGSGQDFVRVYAEETYGIIPEQIIGSMETTAYGYDKDGIPVLTKEPKIMHVDDKGGKPEAIYFMIGRRPCAAFGNSTGDQEMLEYMAAGIGKRLGMLVLHDDATREYAYGPAQGLPESKDGPFTQALYDKAKAQGWTVISMKNDWKQIFAFEKK